MTATESTAAAVSVLMEDGPRRYDTTGAAVAGGVGTDGAGLDADGGWAGDIIDSAAVTKQV